MRSFTKNRRLWLWLFALLALPLGQFLYRHTTPTETKIVFVSRHDSDFEAIYAMDADGSNVRQLTKPTASNHHSPDVSRNGKLIAYTDGLNSRADIWVMNADGTNHRRVTRSWDNYHPVFCPDGTSIVYYSIACSTNLGNTSHIFRISLNGTGRRQLTFGKWDDRNPDVSPDGKHIIFSSNRSGGGYDIYRMAIDGSHLVRLTKQRSEADNPSYSPDGKLIAFTSNRSGRYDVYVIDNNGGNLRCVTNGQEDARHPVFSPDGKQLAYDVGIGEYDCDICTVNLDGSGRTFLTKDFARRRMLHKLKAPDRVTAPLHILNRQYNSWPIWSSNAR